MINEYFSNRIVLRKYNEEVIKDEISSIFQDSLLLRKAFITAKTLYPQNLYHNYTHALMVARYCAMYYNEYSVTKEESIFVIIAAIFHDAMHSGKKLHTDKFNVLASEYYCIKFLKLNHISSSGINIARHCIQNTEYSNNQFKIAALPYQKLIRDADLVGSTQYDIHFSLLEGLFSEIGMEDNLESMVANLQFLLSCKLHSSIAKSIFEQFYLRVQAEL